jgi:hypothetical protein
MGVLDKLFGRNEQATETKAIEVGRKEVSIIEVGSTGTEIFAGYLQEEYLKELQGKEAADIYDKMRRSDPKIKMITSAMKNPIKSASWELVSTEDTDTPESDRQKELLNHILFNDLGGKTWRSFLHEALSMIEFGYSLFEKTYCPVIGHPKFGSYNSIKSLSFRSQRTIERWNLDKAGTLTSVSQYAYGDAQKVVNIPASFLLHFAVDMEGSNFEGISMLRPCYGPWLRKNQFLKLIAAGVEKYAIPIPILDIPSGGENSAEYKKALDALRKYVSHQCNYLIKPKGWDLTLQPNPFDASKIRDVINAENVEMVNAVLANFLELGQSGSGSYSLSFDLSDFFLGGLEYIADQICETINAQLIPELVAMNFGGSPKVKLQCSGISDRAGEELSKVLLNLTQAGILKSDERLEESLRKRFGLPVKDSAALPVAAPVTPGQATPTQTPETQVAELSLNGAQVTSMIEVVTKFKEGVLDQQSAIMILTTAFPITDEQARKIVGDPLKKPVVNLDAAPAPETSPVGKTLALAESVEGEGVEQDPTVAVINDNAQKIRATIKTGLLSIAEDMKKSAIEQWKKEGADRFALPDLTAVPGVTEYQAKISQDLTGTYNSAQSQVSTEIKGSTIKLAEDLKKLAAARLKADVSNLTDVQIADLAKNISLTYGQNIAAAQTAEELASILDEAILKFIDGPVSTTGADIIASKTVNDSRRDFFKENTEKVVSYTWINGDPVSEICQWLDGKTLPADSPDVDRYWPPLHHNCKTYVVANTSDTTENPDPQSGFDVPEDVAASMTLSEGVDSFGRHCSHTLKSKES